MTDINQVEDARTIVDAAVRAVRPEQLLPEVLSLEGDILRAGDLSYDLRRIRRLKVAAVGKAAPFMAKTVLQILGSRVSGGMFLYLPDTRQDIAGLDALPASHPLPDEKSMEAARRLLKLASGLESDDLLLLLLSGGGSAQICLPAHGIALQEKRDVTDGLIRSGADIHEINTVRKHLSAIKGGRLAAAAEPAAVLGLIISDVIGNDLSTIASGPTHWDETSFMDARRVLERYGLWDGAPAAVRGHLEKGARGATAETLRPDHPVFRKVNNRIIGDNRRAVEAAGREAERRGYRTLILTSADSGEARAAAARYAALVGALAPISSEMPPPLCLLAGGELTVTVRGRGRGGRNQEFALAALPLMEKAARRFPQWTLLSLGTDGIDGPTDAAGAWINQDSAEAVRSRSLDPAAFLADNDAYHFFRKTGGLIHTGSTHTNVMDIRVILLQS